MARQDAMLLFPCGYCGVEPGQWCRTVRTRSRPGGQRATWLHQDRWAQVWEVLESSGYVDYLREVDERIGKICRAIRNVQQMVGNADPVSGDWLRSKLAGLLEIW
jgi:hypothetical protein